MQELYDEMLPGITERQGRFMSDVGKGLESEVVLTIEPPARSRAAIEHVVGKFESEDLDGLIIVNLTYSPAMRAARALAGCRLPICLANIQPEASVGKQWGVAELTYNQGIHGIQDTGNALVRGGRQFHVITDNWMAQSFRDSVGVWSRAAAAATMWKRLRVAVFGYPMNGMGDIRVDESGFIRRLGPEIISLAPGAMYRRMASIDRNAIRRALEVEKEHFSVDPRLSGDELEDHARMQLAIEGELIAHEAGAYTAHFDALGEDGRFKRLPLAAASNLLAKGYGFAAEGDAVTAALVSAADRLAGPAQFSEMYAMDFASDSVLMSHMGEGNWRLAREDRPVRLIRRELGIGGLDDPPTFLFQYMTGRATLAALASLDDGMFRLIVCEGEILDSEELPGMEMPYGLFRPDRGISQMMDRWLREGGPHHLALTMGNCANAWQLFSRVVGIDYVEA